MLRILSVKQWISAFLGIIIGLVVANITPPDGLTVDAMHALGILFWAIFWWVGNVLDEYITGILMCIFYIIFANVDTSVSFGLFCDSTWWLLVAAFSLGAGISKSGLLNRFALHAINKFPGNFKGQALGLIGLNFVFAPFIPSLSAKASILAPFALSVSDAMGFKRKDKQANGLFLAMLMSLRTSAVMFISGSVLGYALLGFYPADVQQQFTMAEWFKCAAPWGIGVLILNYLAILLKFKPKKDEKIDNELIKQKIKELGHMKRREKVMLFIMLFTVIMWATESLHGIPAHVIALFGMCIMLSSRIFERKEFRANITWDSLIFIGCAVGISGVFQSLGIDTWLVSYIAPFMTHFAGNPYLLIIVLTLTTILLRFVIVSELAYLSIFMVFLVPMAPQLCVNPWILGIIIYAVANPWIVSYQTPVFMTAVYSTNDEMVEQNVAHRYCFIYLAICILMLLASVPYWQHLGLIY